MTPHIHRVIYVGESNSDCHSKDVSNCLALISYIRAYDLIECWCLTRLEVKWKDPLIFGPICMHSFSKWNLINLHLICFEITVSFISFKSSRLKEYFTGQNSVNLHFYVLCKIKVGTAWVS